MVKAGAALPWVVLVALAWARPSAWPTAHRHVGRITPFVATARMMSIAAASP